MFLRIEIEVRLVEIVFRVDFFESTVVLPFLCICYEITESIDAVGRNVFSVAITIVNLFLDKNSGTALGLPRLFAYSDLGLMT